MRTQQSITGAGRLAAWVLATWVALGVLVPSAYAQDAPDPDQGADAHGQNTDADNAKKAQVYYQSGVKAYFNKKYSLAITYFERANALDPDPVVLYNISLAQSKLGNAKEALDAALQAQTIGGLPKDTARKNRYRIVAFRRALAAQSVCEAINPPAKAKVAKEDAHFGAVGWSGVGAAGLGAAALIGAGVLDIVVSGNMDKYDSARADGNYQSAKSLRADITSGQQLGRVMLYSGVGLVAVGGALFAYDFFDMGESPHDRSHVDLASVSGSVGADRASVQLRWTF